VNPNASEFAWRAGRAPRPYMRDVRRILAKHHAEMPNANIDFLHLPIHDGLVTADALVDSFCDDLIARVHAGRCMYIHCWGGHGRTGTEVAVMLGRMFNMSVPKALIRTQRLHDSREIPQDCRSPSTPCQRAQVVRLLEGSRKKPHTGNLMLTTARGGQVGGSGGGGVGASASRGRGRNHSVKGGGAGAGGPVLGSSAGGSTQGQQMQRLTESGEGVGLRGPSLSSHGRVKLNVSMARAGDVPLPPVRAGMVGLGRPRRGQQRLMAGGKLPRVVPAGEAGGGKGRAGGGGLEGEQSHLVTAGARGMPPVPQPPPPPPAEAGGLSRRRPPRR